MADRVITSTGPCDCCGGACPDCYEITVPVGEAAAFEAAYIRGGFVFSFPDAFEPWDTFTGTTLTAPFEVSASSAGGMTYRFLCYLDLPAGTFTINYDFATGLGASFVNEHNINAELKDCNESAVLDGSSFFDGSAGVSSTGSITVTIPSAGQYVLIIYGRNYCGEGPTSLSVEVTLAMDGMSNVGFCVVEGEIGPPPLP